MAKIQTQLDDEKLSDILEIVCENTAAEWRILASSLGLSKEEQAQITSTHKSSYTRCWQALKSWRTRTQKSMLSHELVAALHNCRLRRIADIVSKLCYCHGSTDEILAPHMNREVRMREAFYSIADGVHSHWRHLAKKLGLSPKEIIEIESRDWGRSREKCMQMLYRWRLMVRLNEYKIGSLIQGLNACGLTEMAVKLKVVVGQTDVLQQIRRKRKGEAIIHIDTELLELESKHSESSSQKQSTQKMSHDSQHDYILNRIFISFQDDLDLQDQMGVHPMVKYFHDINGSNITEVSRRGQYIVVQCQSRDEVHEMYKLARSGDLSERVTECMINKVLLSDVGVAKMRLKAEIYDTELMTTRSDDSRNSLDQKGSLTP